MGQTLKSFLLLDDKSKAENFMDLFAQGYPSVQHNYISINIKLFTTGTTNLNLLLHLKGEKEIRMLL